MEQLIYLYSQHIGKSKSPQVQVARDLQYEITPRQEMDYYGKNTNTQERKITEGYIKKG